MDNIYVLEDETKEIALDKRVADLYVAKIEIEGKAVSSIVEEAGVKAWTILRWKREEKYFIDLLVEARIRIGQSVGGLPFTTLKGQIEKYAGILQQAKADNNGHLEVGNPSLHWRTAVNCASGPNAKRPSSVLR